jgi:branched-chain amino acid transport system ATP-binding protein
MIILEAKKACKYFSGLKAVDQVDMQVQEGQIFGIIGPNGAGKTTLFNICAGTLPLTKGEIWFCGENITDKKQDQVARLGLARTFQNIKMFTQMTVKENIAIGFHIQTKTNMFDSILRNRCYWNDERYISDKTDEILRRLELTEYGDLKASNLPYGLQRKVEIARTVALEPKILLLNEPAAGMNPIETQELMAFVRKLNADGYTIVIIEHDMKVIMNLCDHIMVLNYGKKICEGTPDVIRADQRVQEAYFGRDLAV